MKKTIVILSAVAGMFLVACNNNQTSSIQTGTTTTNSVTANFKSPKADIIADEAFTLSKQNALLIDVREPSELADEAYNVKNIKNIPLGELESRLSEIPKDKQVIVVCQKGGRSSQAYDLLKEKGFENISNMEGGMEAWQEKGLPVIKGGKSMSDSGSEKKSCCANPNSKDCNPDGTCKKTSDKK